MKKINPKLKKDFDFADNLFKEKKYKEATNIYEEILKDNPNLISVKNNLALCYEGLGEFNKAIELLKSFLDTKPEAVFFNNIGRIYFRIKDYNNSIIYLENSLKINNNQIAIIELLTDSYNHLNLSNKIVKLLDNSIKNFSKNRFLNGCFGKSLLKENRHAEGLYYINLGYGVVNLSENEKIKILV